MGSRLVRLKPISASPEEASRGKCDDARPMTKHLVGHATANPTFAYHWLWNTVQVVFHEQLAFCVVEPFLLLQYITFINCRTHCGPFLINTKLFFSYRGALQQL
jgi:hypothetical protein